MSRITFPHEDAQYNQITYCACLLCSSIRKRLMSYKKDSVRKGQATRRLKIALIKLSIFVEISHILQGLTIKGKKLGDIFIRLSRLRFPLETWEGLYRTLTLEDWLTFFL